MAVNKFLLHLVPHDVDSYNRLGKALLEVGDRAAAQQAFQDALERSPSNAISRKNLERLAQMKEGPPPERQSQPLTPHLFIGGERQDHPGGLPRGVSRGTGLHVARHAPGAPSPPGLLAGP